MTTRKTWWNGLAAIGVAAAIGLAFAPLASAQTEKPKSRKERAAAAAAEAAGPQADYSEGFRKTAGPVQTLVTEKKWPEVLAALPSLDALPGKTRDDNKAIATWRLQATQGVGDQDALATAIETYLAEGFADPDSVGAMHRQLAAHYSSKKDNAKTLEHFQAYVDATKDVEPDDYVTLGRLNLQNGKNAEGCQYLGQAIDGAKAKGQKPKDLWFQLRDRCYIEMKDDASRLANLVALVIEYPDKEYYGRIVALYQAQTNDDRTVMLNAYRVAVSDPAGGLATVGGYLSYADTALVAGSPGEAVRALERGMKEGIVPSAGSNQQSLAQAKAAVASDKKTLPAEAAAAAKNPKGEVDVKVGLGFYSTGDYAQAVESVQRGIGKGGVTRLDDANLLLGASLLELGKVEEAKTAFQAAKAAAAPGSPLGQIADMWLARAARGSSAPAAG